MKNKLIEEPVVFFILENKIRNFMVINLRVFYQITLKALHSSQKIDLYQITESK